MTKTTKTLDQLPPLVLQIPDLSDKPSLSLLETETLQDWGHLVDFVYWVLKPKQYYWDVMSRTIYREEILGTLHGVSETERDWAGFLNLKVFQLQAWQASLPTYQTARSLARDWFREFAQDFGIWHPDEDPTTTSWVPEHEVSFSETYMPGRSPYKPADHLARRHMFRSPVKEPLLTAEFMGSELYPEPTQATTELINGWSPATMDPEPLED